ncbi:MAG: hypothetical protein ACK40O_06325 [Allosphingosinicella sp.]
MIAKMLAATAACLMVAAPCAAADIRGFEETGARRSGASAGLYFALPLDGTRSDKAKAGLRLQMTHDYRSGTAQAARTLRADAFELRLLGDRKPTFYAAGMALTDEEAKKRNLTGVGTVVTVAILAAAAVGGYYIVRAIDDSGEE